MSKNKHALEKEVINEIRGVGYSGMESGYAFTSFRQNYYEKIQDDEEKTTVRSILLDFLQNDHYDHIFRSKVAWICADIGMPGIEDELSKMLKEPALKTSVSRELTYILKRFKLENKMKEIMAACKCSNKNDIEDMLSGFRDKLADQLKDPSEKTDVINLLIKFIKSNLYDQVFRIKAAWICADLGIYSIKDEIMKMAKEPLWRESPYRSSLEEIIAFIDDRKGR